MPQKRKIGKSKVVEVSAVEESKEDDASQEEFEVNTHFQVQLILIWAHAARAIYLSMLVKIDVKRQS